MTERMFSAEVFRALVTSLEAALAADPTWIEQAKAALLAAAPAAPSEGGVEPSSTGGAAPAAPEKAQPVAGNWAYLSTDEAIYCDDFSSDARLMLIGDFATESERTKYGDRIAAMLNAATVAHVAVAGAKDGPTPMDTQRLRHSLMEIAYARHDYDAVPFDQIRRDCLEGSKCIDQLERELAEALEDFRIMREARDHEHRERLKAERTPSAKTAITGDKHGS